MPLFSSPYPTIDLETAGNGEYDYIIVGGGTAGCVLANRLSEDSSVKVLLLERGDARLGWATRVPLLSSNFMGDEAAAYSWPSAPVAELDGQRQLNLVTGRGLGGGSSINSMLYTRGSSLEYNTWSANGRKGWSYAELEPYFKKSEKFLGKAGPHHGVEGEWSVRDMGPPYFANAQTCIDACNALGIPFLRDLNDPNAPLSYSARFDCTIDPSGCRSSTFFAFLPTTVATERKSHLHICTGAAVTRVNVDTTSGLAHSVSFVSDKLGSKSEEYTARARKEFIMCAGAICTPQILLLSGIGPNLKSAVVPGAVVKELPGVGQCLQDHMATGILYNVPTEDSLHVLKASKLRSITELFRYVVFGDGLFLAPVTQVSILVDSSCIDESGNFTPSSERNLPDLELMPIHFNYSEPPIPHEAGVFSLKVGLMRPFSHGSVTLASPDDPLERPTCDLAFLSDPRDLEVMRRGLRLAKRIAEKMRALGCGLRDLYLPASEADADLDAFVRKTARTTYHYGCTCRMAPEADAGVVDDELRVHGIRNLRIADCSILPNMLSTHLQAPAVMIAEKCADMVKADARVA